MIVLELFAGSRSIGKAAEAAGHTVVSCDITQFGNIDLVGDILDIPIQVFKDLKPDMIWASPPCTTFSIAGCSHHYDIKDGEPVPKSDKALEGLAILQKTLDIIKECKPKYWFIENPRGLMRKSEKMQGLARTTVWYCKYGDKRAKPTDIWSNHIANLFNQDGWLPRAECFNGNNNCHHDKCPRGTNNGLGTQGLSGNHERSKIPAQLCKEIIESIS